MGSTGVGRYSLSQLYDIVMYRNINDKGAKISRMQVSCFIHPKLAVKTVFFPENCLIFALLAKKI